MKREIATVIAFSLDMAGAGRPGMPSACCVFPAKD